MLILTILLVAFALPPQTISINLTYIVKKDSGNGFEIPSCIAEENERYGGVGWIFPINPQEPLPNITTKFIPTIQSNFNCKFSKKDKCSKLWTIKDYWEIERNSTRNFDLILDERWQDFPTILTTNATKFNHRFEIPTVFRAGFSIRSENPVEFLLCEGWNPPDYPCYLLNISLRNIYLRKISSYNDHIDEAKVLDYYSAFSNILSKEEWRTFVITFNAAGILRLYDVTTNRTVIQYEDNEQLKPIYILIRSQSAALWKIHEQNQFLYTKTAQITRFGPVLNVNSDDLCISFYVSLCTNCKLTFLRTDGNGKKILKELLPPSKEQYEWTLVKLKEEHIKSDRVTIFVQTEFLDGNQSSDGFWAIDDVRICHENEVKVTFLKYNASENDEVTCQMVQHPKWRPRKYSYSSNNGFPEIETTSTNTSITLNWTEEDPHHILNYFLTYKANDMCESAPFNADRLKSAGFLQTKHDEITIDNLVPFTKYNITFSSILHETEKLIFANTQESPYPTVGELPNKVQIQVQATTAHVSWEKLDCSQLYGHILYALTVIDTSTGDSKELSTQTENSVSINDLKPFTTYTLKIITARSFETIENGTAMSINFTTQAGTAHQVDNLEVYATGNDSVSFRYELPSNITGIPQTIQISRCSELLYKKCKSKVTTITPCKLFPKKYCIDLLYLGPNTEYTFKVSLKNLNTNSFGVERIVKAVTEERVPGAPWNVTYRMVDCQNVSDACHLNISWSHPVDQNGTITAFNIILNGTDNTTKESIHEILQITNRTYSASYEYQIKYIPYSSRYDLYVQSVNQLYKSNLTHIEVITDDLGDHIDQNPKLLEATENRLIFKLPPIDHRLQSYNVTIVVQDFDRNVSLTEEILQMDKVGENLCHNFGNVWALEPLQIDNTTQNVTIGKNTDLEVPITPETQYCVTFIITNIYRNKAHDVVYVTKLETPKSTKKTGSSEDKHYYILFLLLLLAIPLGFCLHRYIKKRRARRPKKSPQENKENVYESLPFEDCEENNCVSNANYDHLLHK